MFNLNKKNKGFTLLEVLLSVSLITIFAGISVPIYQSLQVRNDLDIAAMTVVQSLRRAQVLAQSVDGDISWGVKAQSNNIILFKGVAYDSRDANFDEVFDLSPIIIPSGVQEIVFEKFTGKPQMTGALILTSNNNETRTVTINEKGTINY